MTLRGTIQNGRLVLDDGASLPDGTRVEIAVKRPRGAGRAKAKPSDTLGRIASRAVKTGKRSLAADHDALANSQPRTASKAKRRSAR